MLESFKNRMANQGYSQASAYRKNAEDIIDNTFIRDPMYKEVFITHSPSGMSNIKYDAKFSIHTKRSVVGDSEDYFLMFRPHISVPIGSYVDIPDADGVLQRWLIVIRDDKPQFPMYYILKCNWILKWKINNVVYKCQCVQRTQSSYNSGLWTDYVTTTVENQTIMLLPTTPYTQKLNYDQRVLINDDGRDVPIAWKISKVMDTIPKGITRLTFVQEVADIQEDCGKYGIAGLCKNSLHSSSKPETCKNCTMAEPTYIDAGVDTEVVTTRIGKISYKGKDATIRVGGSAKNLVSEFWNGEEVVHNAPVWTISLKDGDTILCAVNLKFRTATGWDVSLADINPAGVILETNSISFNKKDIICSNGNDILRINVETLNDSIGSIKLRCLQLYSMVGKNIFISACDDNGDYETNIALEVVS